MKKRPLNPSPPAVLANASPAPVEQAGSGSVAASIPPRRKCKRCKLWRYTGKGYGKCGHHGWTTAAWYGWDCEYFEQTRKEPEE